MRFCTALILSLIPNILFPYMKNLYFPMFKVSTIIRLHILLSLLLSRTYLCEHATLNALKQTKKKHRNEEEENTLIEFE